MMAIVNTSSGRSSLTISSLSLVDQLKQLRRRQLTVASVTALLWGLLAGIVLLLVAIWLDMLWELPAAVRRMCLPLAGVLSICVAAMSGIRAGRSARLRSLADQADRVAVSGGEFRSGFDLAFSSLPGTPLSSGLAQLAMMRAGARFQDVDRRRLMPFRRLTWATSALFGLAGLIGVLAVAMPKLAATQWSRMIAPSDGTPPFSLIEFQVTPGDVEIPYGASLDVSVTTNMATVDDLELVLQTEGGPEEIVPMFAVREQQWQAPLARIAQPLDYFVRAGRARSHSHNIGLIMVPEIREAQYQLSPPAYTRRAIQSGTLAADSIVGLKQTAVRITVSSNRPLSRGEIKLNLSGNMESIEMQPTGEDNQSVFGTFQITASGTCEIRVQDIDGRHSQQSLVGSIMLEKDQTPFVRLTQPQPLSLATPTALIPVTVVAEDDYGISSLSLFRILNDSRPSATKFAGPEGTNRWQQNTELPLVDYGLQPGDEIKLFGRVEDNDPDGPKGNESPVHTIHIISQSDFDQLQRQQAGIEEFFNKFAEIQRRLEAIDNAFDDAEEKLLSDDLSPENAEELNRLNERMRKETSAIRNLSKQQLPMDLEKELEKKLAELIKQLEEAAAELDQLQKQAEQGELTGEQLQEAMKKLRAKLGMQRQDFQDQVMVPLDQLKKAIPLLALQQEFVQIVLRQRDLADRSKTVIDKDGVDDPEAKRRMIQMSDEQDTLRMDLEFLLQEIRNAATQLPEIPEFEKLRQSAMEFAGAVSDSGAIEEQDDAAIEFAEFIGSRGHQHAEQAARILESFLNDCQGMGDCAGEACEMCFKPGLNRPGLGNSLQQLAKMMGWGTNQGGMGIGMAGRGFSQQRGPMNNMGLYGNRPISQAAARSGQGADQRVPGGTIPDRTTEPLSSAANQVSARERNLGAAAASVPQKYERRVGAYFQRLVDELGDQVFETEDSR